MQRIARTVRPVPLLVVAASTAFASTAIAAPGTTLELAWGELTHPDTLRLMINELQKPAHPGASFGAPPDIVPLPKPKWGEHPNPFNLTPRDFWVDMALTYPDTQAGPVPEITAQDAVWFDQAVAQGKAPDIFLIGGHNVISEGFHDDEEGHFLYVPTLFRTVQKYPAARAYFAKVKLAILWGCNTLTNLEPHGPNGEFLNQAQIRELYSSSREGRARAIGAASKTNTLEFYKSRLAREYGPGTAKYEYTRSPKREKCAGPGRYENCDITDLERIMPETGLFDGTHRYNNPYLMKRLFPNAYLVLGFSSASPNEDVRARILAKTLKLAYAELNARKRPGDSGYVSNAMLEIVSPDTDDAERQRVITVIRKYWTVATYEMNRHRPSGSITPAYPELDRDGTFGAYVSADTPPFAPYEERAPLRPR